MSAISAIGVIVWQGRLLSDGIHIVYRRLVEVDEAQFLLFSHGNGRCSLVGEVLNDALCGGVELAASERRRENRDAARSNDFSSEVPKVGLVVC